MLCARPLGRRPTTKKATIAPAALIEEFLEPLENVREKRYAQALSQLREGVTERELRHAQKLIKGKITDKYKRLDTAFKVFDRDRLVRRLPPPPFLAPLSTCIVLLV